MNICTTNVFHSKINLVRVETNVLRTFERYSSTGWNARLQGIQHLANLFMECMVYKGALVVLTEHTLDFMMANLPPGAEKCKAQLILSIPSPSDREKESSKQPFLPASNIMPLTLRCWQTTPKALRISGVI